MKTQIKFQKILAFVSLIISVLVFVYALIFFSGNLSGEGLMYYLGSRFEGSFDGADCFLLPAQAFDSALIVISIIGILVSTTLFITSCNKRRNYYITNYVAIGLNVAMGVFVGFFMIIFLAVLMAQFYGGVDWVALQDFIDGRKNYKQEYYEVSKSPLMFIIGLLISILTLANAAAWILNLIWKIKLMRGEKELLENGLVKEVA